jgi:transcriptional regulator with XRE-family HTH domain
MGVSVCSAVATRLERIQKSGIKARDVAQLLGTRPETVSRWRTGRVDPQPEKLHRLLALEYIWGELVELFGAEEGRLWLFAPHRLLAGATPASRIESGQTDDVLTLIAQLRDGTFG